MDLPINHFKRALDRADPAVIYQGGSFVKADPQG